MGSIKDNSDRRIEDSEILFVTLILILGEPPMPPTSMRSAHLIVDAQLKYVSDNRDYGVRVKNWMGELGHNPHQGLYTEYMYWVKEKWHGQKKQALRG